MTMDTIKVAVLIGIAAALVAIISLGFVVLANAGSRNLVLAAGALAGAAVFFAVQLSFELQPSTRVDYVSSEYTIDRAQPSIYQWKYTHTDSRWTADIAANQWLSENKPAAFEGNRERLTLDRIVFCILQYIVFEQPDWRVTRYNVLKGSFGQSSSRPIFPERSECTPLTADALNQRLEAVSNSFAHASDASLHSLSLSSSYVCLPPDTDLTVMKDGLIIKNPFCTVTIRVDPTTITSFGNFEPYMFPTNGPFLPNGEPEYETRVTGINVTVNYSRFRAQHLKMEKYHKWADRLVDGLSEWFEVPPRGITQRSDRTDAVNHSAHP